MPEPMTVVNAHKSNVPSDPNNKLHVEGFGESCGGAHHTYKVSHEGGPDHVTLDFMTLERAGLTNEVLLAIVYDRLRGFQGGQFPCEENERAMTHVHSALHSLKNRTNRRHHAGLEGKMAEDKAEAKHRVRLENDVLHVGDKQFTMDQLQAWKTWHQVESAAKALKPEVSSLEVEVFEKAAAHLGGGARNGLAELKSALASARKAG